MMNTVQARSHYEPRKPSLKRERKPGIGVMEQDTGKEKPLPVREGPRRGADDSNLGRAKGNR